MAVIVLGALCLIWGLIGLGTILSPKGIMVSMSRSLQNPWRRFLITQGMLVCGLILIVGTLTLEGFWLWIGCGLIMVVKACVVLGVSDSFRARIVESVTQWPHWIIRVGGTLNLCLAVLLAGDLILHG